MGIKLESASLMKSFKKLPFFFSLPKYLGDLDKSLTLFYSFVIWSVNSTEPGLLG